MAASRHAGGFLMAHGNQSAGRLEVEVEVRDGKPKRIMSDKHAGHRQFAEYPSDLASRCRIEMGGSLIHEQGVRTHVKRTGEEETLPLPVLHTFVKGLCALHESGKGVEHAVVAAQNFLDRAAVRRVLCGSVEAGPSGSTAIGDVMRTAG